MPRTRFDNMSRQPVIAMTMTKIETFFADLLPKVLKILVYHSLNVLIKKVLLLKRWYVTRAFTVTRYFSLSFFPLGFVSLIFRQAQFGVKINTTNRSNEDLSLNTDISGGSVTTINIDDISPNTPSGLRTSTARGLGSRASGAGVDSQQQLSQAHLLEQLIGMQNAIESMETPMEQSEETMSVFMNMLEADAGLGGDFEDLS